MKFNVSRTIRTTLVSAICAVGMTGAAAAAPISSGPVDPLDIVSFGGLDWAWASPCSATSPSCGTFEITAEQSGFGWRLPTALEVSTHIAADIVAFVSTFDTGTGSDAGWACASAWFDGSHDHCDESNGLSGLIWNLPGVDSSISETFVVRGAVPPIPVPAALPLLMTALGGMVALRRRRKMEA